MILISWELAIRQSPIQEKGIAYAIATYEFAVSVVSVKAVEMLAAALSTHISSND
jgi:hypothetical protein